MTSLAERRCRRIAIVGMGRSGTTFVTEFLGKCGVFLDEVNWAHEHELARLINDSILAREFGATEAPPYGTLPEHEIALSEYWSHLAHMYVRYMDARAADAGGVPFWAFKDPRTTVLHSIWMSHVDVIVGVFRAPQEVVASYIGRGWVKGWSKRTTALRYWTRFNRSLLYIHRTHGHEKPIYLLHYKDDIGEQVARVVEHLGLTVSDEARALFNADLKHYDGAAQPRQPDVVKLYEELVGTKGVAS